MLDLSRKTILLILIKIVKTEQLIPRVSTIFRSYDQFWVILCDNLIFN